MLTKIYARFLELLRMKYICIKYCTFFDKVQSSGSAVVEEREMNSQKARLA